MTNLNVAFRQLARAPGFTLVAILTLSLGIGLSTGSFSMANAFLLRNVPYPEPERLVRVFRASAQSERMSHPPGSILDVRETVQSFSGFSLLNFDNMSFTEPGRPAVQVFTIAATADFLNVLGVQPALGRGFAAGDDEPDKPLVSLLTHRGWMRHYSGDPAVIGQTVRLNAQTYTIVGVLPPHFDAPLVWGPVDFLLPRTIYPDFRTARKDAWMHAVARLKSGVSLRQAEAELATVAARLRQQFPKESGDDRLRAMALHSANMDSVSRAVLWLMTAISLTMLLIACANLASLQVARALGRTREFAVRTALGGSRTQVMMPLLAESVVLSVGGGIGGLFVASWSNSIIGSLLRINGEPGFPIPLDPRVFGFAAFASLLSGVAFGFAPALLATRTTAGEALKEGSRGATGGRSHQRIKSVLIIAEMGLALALVAVAASFGVGTRAFLGRQLGWEIDGLYHGNLALPYNAYNDDARNRAFQHALLERLQRIPGVENAVISTGAPLYSLGFPTPIVVEGEPPAERGREPLAEIASVSPEFFKALRIPLKSGALFPPNLSENDRGVAIINEAFARRFWPDGNAVGRRVRTFDREQWVEIVGVVGDVKMAGRFDTPPTRLQMYRPLIQQPSRYLAVNLKTSLRPESLNKSVADAIAAVDADLPVTNGGSLRALFERNWSNINLVIVNLSISAAMGLLIAAIGVFGVVSQLIAQRTRDIGVRIALGAQASDIMRMILGEGARFLAIGILVGVPLFFGLNTVVQRAIPEMTLPGAWLLTTNVALLGCAMMLACWMPARRATLINPVEALRAE